MSESNETRPQTPESAQPLPDAAEQLLPEDASRRRLLLAGLGVGVVCYAGALAYPIYRYLAAPARKAAEAASITEVELKPDEIPGPGTGKVIRFGMGKVIVISHAADSYVAFDAKCTHLGCTVAYEGDKDRIHCACHGGVYDAYTGKNVSGPPPKPLTPYKVVVADGKVVVSRA